MTICRLSLMLALLTTPDGVYEEDDTGDDRPRAVHPKMSRDLRQDTNTVLRDVRLHPDGSVASFTTTGAQAARDVPWSLVRLVLPDLAEQGERVTATLVAVPPETSRSAQPVPLGRDGALSLRRLTGTPVVDAHGDGVGVLRGALIDLPLGTAIAIAIEFGRRDGGGTRVIAIPWDGLDLNAAVRTGRAILDESLLPWIRTAPRLDANLPAGGTPGAEARKTGAPGLGIEAPSTPDELFADWSDPR